MLFLYTVIILLTVEDNSSLRKSNPSHTAPARGRACGEVCRSEPGLHAEPEIG